MTDGTIIGIDTFVIPEGVEPHSKEEQKIVAVAEKLFGEMAAENGMDEDELEPCLDDGFYENGTFKLIIHWSNEDTHLKVK